MQKEKRVAEDEMVRLQHQPKGHEFEFEQTPRDSERQQIPGDSPWGHKELDRT